MQQFNPILLLSELKHRVKEVTEPRRNRSPWDALVAEFTVRSELQMIKPSRFCSISSLISRLEARSVTNAAEPPRSAPIISECLLMRNYSVTRRSGLKYTDPGWWEVSCSRSVSPERTLLCINETRVQFHPAATGPQKGQTLVNRLLRGHRKFNHHLH